MSQQPSVNQQNGMPTAPAPRPSYRPGTTLVNRVTGERVEVVAPNPKDPAAPFVRRSTSPRAPSGYDGAYSQMMTQMRAPAPPITIDTGAPSAYAQDIALGAQIAGSEQYQAAREQQIAASLKAMGDIGTAEYHHAQALQLEGKARDQAVIESLVSRVLNGDFKTPEEERRVGDAISLLEGKQPQRTTFRGYFPRGGVAYRMNDQTGEVTPILGPNGKPIRVPASSRGFQHPEIQLAMSARTILSQLRSDLAGLAPALSSDMSLKLPAGMTISGADAILSHPSLWGIKAPGNDSTAGDNILAAYRALRSNAAAFGVDIPEVTDPARALGYIRALSQRGGTSQLGVLGASAEAPELRSIALAPPPSVAPSRAAIPGVWNDPNAVVVLPGAPRSRAGKRGKHKPAATLARPAVASPSPAVRALLKEVTE